MVSVRGGPEAEFLHLGSDPKCVRALALWVMVEEFDVEALIARFRDRAGAVKRRNLPPVAGPERTRLLEQAQMDFQDFAIVGDAEGELVDGILTLKIDLRPEDAKSSD